ADYVGPGQVAWFQFTIQAPQTAGVYKLYIRPLIEGAQWMEDYGVFWQVTVKGADAVGSIAVAPSSAASVEVGGSRSYTATVTDATGCVDLAFIDDAAYPATPDGGLADADLNGKADLSTAAVFALVNGSTAVTSYVDCVTVPADQTVTFVVSSTVPNTNVRPVIFRDDSGNNALDVGASYGPTEPWGLGGPVRFIPIEATTGPHTVTVFAVSTAEDYFTDAGATGTYRYDSNDTFQRAGANLSFAQFEQVLSDGDVVSVSYQANEANASTFSITTDVGRDAPTVEAIVDSWDQGPTQNDIGVRITEPVTNANDIAYSVQRAATGAGTGCDPGLSYAQLALIATPRRTDTTFYVDRDLGVGAYCYRVAATDPVSGTAAFGYSQRVVINNPPLAVAPPRALDARVTTSAGSLALLDTGDVIKIAFDKAMRAPLGREMRVQDLDGTIGAIRCLQVEQGCTVNSGVETLGGVAYPANTVLTITMRTDAIVVANGASAGLQLNVTVTSGTFADEAGNTWDVNGSQDVTLGAPD
ncbi:MAG: hypothetical protein ABJB39_06765, partial [Chloroflexota bacterium]